MIGHLTIMMQRSKANVLRSADLGAALKEQENAKARAPGTENMGGTWEIVLQ